jgi:hypothetical protein
MQYRAQAAGILRWSLRTLTRERTLISEKVEGFGDGLRMTLARYYSYSTNTAREPPSV